MTFVLNKFNVIQNFNIFNTHFFLARNSSVNLRNVLISTSLELVRDTNFLLKF